MIKAIINSEASGFANLVKRIASDKRLATVHVSLCAALFVAWQRDGFQNPFSVSRKNLMSYSRIASKATYHKCMRDLDGYGYIRYQPSYHPKKGSLVYWPDGLK